MQTCDEIEQILLDQKGAERRAWVRFPTDDAARMKVLEPLGAKAAEVRILDVSQGGLKLRVPAMLVPGTLIQIDLKNAVLVAQVRYCVEAELGFHTGVQLREVSWVSDGSSESAA